MHSGGVVQSVGITELLLIAPVACRLDEVCALSQQLGQLTEFILAPHEAIHTPLQGVPLCLQRCNRASSCTHETAGC